MASDAEEFEVQRRKKARDEGKFYRKKITALETIPDTLENQYFIMCLGLTDDIFKAKRLYRTLDIVELWRLTALKNAKDYSDPFADNTKEPEWT